MKSQSLLMKRQRRKQMKKLKRDWKKTKYKLFIYLQKTDIDILREIAQEANKLDKNAGNMLTKLGSGINLHFEI